MRTIVSVQALRAIAALAVAMCHFDELRVWLAGHQNGPYPLYAFASGVDLFFVISGFVMVYSSGDLFSARNGAVTFLGRRFARIAPLYWLATAIAIPVMSLPHDWGSLLASYLFIPYRQLNGTIVPSLGVGWTLNFEMYFYVLFSAAVILRRSIAVPAVCGALVLIVFLGHLLQPTFAPLQFWSDPIALEFVFGMTLALFYIRGVRLPAPLRFCLVISGIAVLGFFDTNMPPSGFRVIQWGVPAAMIFAGTVLGTDINFGWLRGTVKTLGDASYALYLTHPLMIAAVYLGWIAGLKQYPKTLVLSLGLVAAQVISIAVFYLFERRSNRFLKRILVAGHPIGPRIEAVANRQCN